MGSGFLDPNDRRRGNSRVLPAGNSGARPESVFLFVVSGFSVTCALFTRTDFAQPLPRINSEVVTVVPVELDSVLANALRGIRFDRRLKHGQLTRLQFHRLPRLSATLAALFVA